MSVDQKNHIRAWEEQLERYPLRQIEVDGNCFSYRHRPSDGGRSGDDKCGSLVLLHGIGSASSSWIKQFESLDGSYDILAWDMPGYGNSSLIEKSRPVADDYAKALWNFLRAKEVGRPVLVGHSLGGLIAVAFARRWPDNLSGLFLANPALGYHDLSETAQDEKTKSRMAMFEELGPSGLADERASKLLSPHAGNEDIDLVKYNMRRLQQDGYRAACEMLVTGKALEDAAEYEGSVSIVCGDMDEITPPQNAQALAEKFPSAHFSLLKGAGHASYIEQPLAFETALISYIERRDVAAMGEDV